MGIELLGGSVKFGVDFFPLLSSFVGDSASLCSFGGSGTSFVAYLRLTTTSYLLSCVSPQCWNDKSEPHAQPGFWGFSHQFLLADFCDLQSSDT